MMQNSFPTIPQRANWRKWVVRTVSGGLLAAAVAVGPSWGLENTPAVDAADPLAEVLPAYAPEGLTEDDFAGLGPNWQAWSEETVEAINRLYEAESLSEREQALERLRIKRRTMKTALGDSRYASIHDDLAELHTRLDLRIELTGALLDTLTGRSDSQTPRNVSNAWERVSTAVSSAESRLNRVNNGSAWKSYLLLSDLRAAAARDAMSDDAVNLLQDVAGRLSADGLSDEQQKFLDQSQFESLAEAINGALAAIDAVRSDDGSAPRTAAIELSEAIEEYEEDASSEAAAALRDAYNRLRQVAPDGGERIGKVLRRYFYNYNLRVVIDEGLLKRAVADSRYEQGIVNDCIMEARVTGNQWTQTQVGVDVRPSSDSAKFVLTLDGNVQSQTRGVTDQATVFTRGNHFFHAEKPVYFDGDRYYTAPTTIGVNVNNTTTGVRTKYSNILLFGKIADNIARKEVAKRRPQTNAIARQKVSSRVQSRFDEETDSLFDQATTDLQSEVYDPLRELDLYPDAKQVYSTDDAIYMRTRLMHPDEVAGAAAPPRSSVPNGGVLIQVHESLLNNSTDRMGLAGRTMTEAELQAEIERRLEILLGREVNLEASETETADGEEADEGNTLIFDEQDPVRFQIGNGVIEMTLRAGLRREGQEDIPTQIISVPLEFVVEDGNVLARRAGSVGVRPVTRPPRIAEQIARANVMRNNIRQALPDRQLDGTITVEQDQRVIALQVREVIASAGWLTITAR